MNLIRADQAPPTDIDGLFGDIKTILTAKLRSGLTLGILGARGGTGRESAAGNTRGQEQSGSQAGSSV
jgi:hypothetical protein